MKWLNNVINMRIYNISCFEERIENNCYIFGGDPQDANKWQLMKPDETHWLKHFIETHWLRPFTGSCNREFLDGVSNQYREQGNLQHSI